MNFLDLDVKTVQSDQVDRLKKIDFRKHEAYNLK